MPKDGGYDSRYQVHIECLSADDSLPIFLTNPEKAGESKPLYLKCPTGFPLFLIKLGPSLWHMHSVMFL
ncbi:hypothetical protein BG55_18860 [Erwinia mallotivora]|uniref:Uncharacterized protein n=1 Tax=Erwinia mallotivora TaxID=69222 RepID=A0A014NK20_9GAMM|nr:hypothetical protein BG55_18860 [Erwinia mallotivora]